MISRRPAIFYLISGAIARPASGASAADGFRHRRGNRSVGLHSADSDTKNRISDLRRPQKRVRRVQIVQVRRSGRPSSDASDALDAVLQRPFPDAV